VFARANVPDRRRRLSVRLVGVVPGLSAVGRLPHSHVHPQNPKRIRASEEHAVVVQRDQRPLAAQHRLRERRVLVLAPRVPVVSRIRLDPRPPRTARVDEQRCGLRVSLLKLHNLRLVPEHAAEHRPPVRRQRIGTRPGYAVVVAVHDEGVCEDAIVVDGHVGRVAGDHEAAGGRLHARWRSEAHP